MIDSAKHCQVKYPYPIHHIEMIGTSSNEKKVLNELLQTRNHIMTNNFITMKIIINDYVQIMYKQIIF